MTATTAGTETAAADAETTLDGFEMVVGLEVHVELATATKLFSSSPNRFGDEPNTNIDPVTLGLPGSLPVLNRRAVELAMRIGLALHCEVRPCLFHRKNYFYPDMPKDYQISQYDQPLNVDGWLELPSGKRIGIERAHMEEDTGKSTHVGGAGGRIHGSDYSLVDYNRAGVPLVEIVGRPDIANAEEARQYVNELRAILVAIDASDAKMEEGSMRVDANVSVRRPGEPYGTRCEVKNLNSVRSLGRAIEYEARRQVQLIDRRGDGSAGDPALGRERRSHPHPSDQGRRRRLPLLPRARSRAPGPGSGLGRGDPRGPATAARRASRPIVGEGPGRQRERGRRHRRGAGPGRAGRRRPSTPGATRRACSSTWSTTCHPTGRTRSPPLPSPP